MKGNIQASLQSIRWKKYIQNGENFEKSEKESNESFKFHNCYETFREINDEYAN